MRSWKNNSLRLRLMVACLGGMLLTAALFIAILSLVFSWQFDLITSRGMRQNAISVAAHLKFDAQGKPQRIVLPEEVRWVYEQLSNDVEFRVVDRQGAPVSMPAASPGRQDAPRLLSAYSAPPSVDEPIHIKTDTRNVVVVAVPVLETGGSYFVQAAASERLLEFAGLSLAHPIPKYIIGLMVISMPVVGGLMLFVLLRLLRPLRAVSAEASRIDPRNMSARLSVQTVPSELVPLIDSFNLALERLEQGFREQQQFLGAAAHELKTPLALMRGQIELDGIADRATLLGDIDVMTRHVQQLLHLAEASEVRNYRMEPIDVHHALADAAAFLARMADRRGIRINLSSLPESAESVQWAGDKGALFTLIKNLLENAIQHSPEGGVISLQVEGNTAISVRDHGCGIAADDMLRVFERFWRGHGRADGQAPGAGLGMSICKEIAAAHGWRIEIGNAMPGAVFRVVRAADLPGA